MWQRAHALTLSVYEATRSFPKEEIYGLTSQVRRAASSIAANIAEGCGRDSDADFKRFLQIAMGSATELDYHLVLAHDLKFLDDAVYRELVVGVSEVKRMLAAFIVRLRGEP